MPRYVGKLALSKALMREEGDMKKLCFFALIGFVAGTVSGGGFDKASVPVNAQWIAHIDVDVYRGTSVSETLSSIRPDKHRRGIAFLKEQLGIDPMEDISSVTLYGSDRERKDAVAVVKGNLDAARISQALEKNRSHQKMSRGDYILHKWKDRRRGVPCVASFIAEDTVVLAGSVAEVMESAKVHKGASKSLADAGEKGLQTPELRAGGFLMASLNGGAEGLNQSAQAKVFRNAKAMTLAVGEIDGQVRMDLNVTAENRDAAVQVEIVFMGLRAAALLNEEREPGLANLAKNLTIASNGDKVRVLLASRPEELRVLFPGR